MASRRRPFLRRLLRRALVGALLVGVLSGLRELAVRRHDPPSAPPYPSTRGV